MDNGFLREDTYKDIDTLFDWIVAQPGLDAARLEGRVGGRRPKLSDQQQSEIQKMVSKGDKTAADAARLFKVHPATVSRLLARASVRKAGYAK